MKRSIAVLDTSYWSVACSLNLDAYLYDFFKSPLYIAQPTLDEIVDETRRGPWVSPDRRRMEIALQDGRIAVPAVRYGPLPEFGEGERHAIGLAKALNGVLLINDLRPYLAAQRLCVVVVSAPEFVLMASRAGLVNPKQAMKMLDTMESVTANALISATKAQLQTNDEGGDERE